MGFFAFFVVLLLDQARPLGADNRLRLALGSLIDLVRSSTDAGQAQQGWIGWAIVAISVGGVTLAVEWLAGAIHPIFEWIFHVAVLYVVIGFRQTAVVFTEMQVALALDDAAGARKAFDRWQAAGGPSRSNGTGVPADAPIEEVCRESIVLALLHLHRGICAPLFWYLVLPGVLGPLLFWLAGEMTARWSSTMTRTAPPDAEDVSIAPAAASSYGDAAERIFRWIDWLPLRATAAGFAVSGNFDDAVYCWRGAVASQTASDQRSLLTAAASGATGLRLADSALEARWASASQSFDWPGKPVETASLRVGMRLIYRSMLLWLGLFALLGLASWLGR